MRWLGVLLVAFSLTACAPVGLLDTSACQTSHNPGCMRMTSPPWWMP
jgi:hypothetical protein